METRNRQQQVPSEPCFDAVDVRLGERKLSVPMHVARSGEFAATAGLAQARERLWRAVIAIYETGLFPGVSVCVMHQNQPLLHRGLGYASLTRNNQTCEFLSFNQWCDGGGGVSMKPEMPVCLFSASKMVMAMLIHWLVDQGTLRLDEPIAEYLPQLSSSPLGLLSLVDVLSHRASLPFFPKDAPLDILFDPPTALEALSSVSSGEDNMSGDFAYHAVAGGVLVGAIIEATAGCGIEFLLDRVLRQPLGLTVFSYGLPRSLRDNADQECVHDYLTGEKPNLIVRQWIQHLLGATLEGVIQVTRDKRFLQTPIPAANLYARPEEMCRFLQVLMHHGRYGSETLFSPEVVSKALEPVEGIRFDKRLMLPMRYSAGFMLGANPVGLWGPFSQRSFGHFGFTNKLCWANPKSQTTVCLAPNGNCMSGTAIKAMVPFVVEVQRLAGVF